VLPGWRIARPAPRKLRCLTPQAVPDEIVVLCREKMPGKQIARKVCVLAATLSTA
jgi:hypothetical protein